MTVLVEVACDRCGDPLWRLGYRSFVHAVRYAEDDALVFAEDRADLGLDGRGVRCKACRGDLR